MSQTYSQNNLVREIAFQGDLVAELVENQDYLHRISKEHYDRSSALDKDLVLRFIRSTQSNEWENFEKRYKDKTEQEFFSQLEKNLKQHGTLSVLRNGIKIIPGFHFKLCYPKPASKINPTLQRFFEANILSVIDELEYSKKNKNRIDVVLFINGIPVITIECKNIPSDKTFKDAEKQYRKDRSPDGEPLLTFKRGALVHFAMDEDNVSMTTRLGNGNTYFLPFNRGNNGGAGNPDDFIGNFRVAYLYQDQKDQKAIFSKETLLDIIERFMHLYKDKDTGKETMIFPRYQQLDAVLKIIKHAKKHGTGNNYLIQHSAGSGKSNTIAWTAHRLANLHDENDNSIFDTVIIVTDRVVLDKQLQNTITQFEQTKGVVESIEGTSKQLKEALKGGYKIIISTIQKFSTENLQTLSGQGKRCFAVLIDEAHSSQSGKHSDNMSQALASEEEEYQTTDIEALIQDHQHKRGPQKNISYFAFTATPKNVTLELFGSRDSSNLPHPFHTYSMRQAIEEGFILDVLKNYTTYKAYFQLEKTIEEDPQFPENKARKKIAKFANLHPTAVIQRVKIIVEHFLRHVAIELDGQGKAMIVTQGRQNACEYYFAIKKYIEENNYKNLHPLVAFSSEIKIEGQSYTESGLNGFLETELPNQFDGGNYQLLIVAKKYQTGFDQPKLCGMYIDQKLDGLQTVQTLSRLNRTHPKKNNTYILDFQNTMDEIKEAFKPYYETTYLEEITDPNEIYGLQTRIMQAAIIFENDINTFAETYYRKRLLVADRGKLEKLIKLSVERFEQKQSDEEKEEFRQLLKSYMRFYSFVSQMVTLYDTDLEKLYAYASWLSRFLPNRDIPHDVEVTNDMLELRAMRVEQKEQGSASLQAGETSAENPIEKFGANPVPEQEEISLSQLVDDFNNRFGTDFTDDDFLTYRQVKDIILNDEKLRDIMENNPDDVIYKYFAEKFLKETIETSKRRGQLQTILMKEDEGRKQIIDYFFEEAIKQIATEKEAKKNKNNQ